MHSTLSNKLEQVLNSLKSKIYENIDFLKTIDIESSKDSKKHCAKIYYNNSLLHFKTCNNSISINKEDILQKILLFIKDMDNCVITYNERGTSIKIWTEKNNVKIKYIDQSINEEDILHSDVSCRSNRNYLIKDSEAKDLLREIGIMTTEGKIKNDMIRKYNQIDHFVELVDIILKEVNYEEVFTVLDCACGKSYLSFVLNYYIKEKLKKPCRFIGIDISQNVINASNNIAQNLGYRNMEFQTADIKTYKTDKKVDMVISLHGCDIATDMAIAAGIKMDAQAIVVVPCCHREILNQYTYEPFSSILKHGILKARMADVITEGIRLLILEAMGYDVSIVEYISPLDTPKNLLIRAIKKGNKNREAYEDLLKLKDMLQIDPALARFLNI